MFSSTVIRRYCLALLSLAINQAGATSLVIISDNAKQPRGCFIPTETVTRIVDQAQQLDYQTIFENSKNYDKESLARADLIIDLTDDSRFARAHCNEYASKFIIFIWEPPTVIPELWNKDFQDKMTAIFTFNDNLLDSKHYFKSHYPTFWGAPHEWPQNSFSKKKLCTMILANKKSSQPESLYALRRTLVDFLENNHLEDFEFYGTGWNNGDHKAYRGAPEGNGVIKNYRFCFCFENTAAPGYITEKIFNIFGQKTVPVYIGATNVNRYIPDNCFVNFSSFASLEDCYKFLKNMDETTYNEYLQNIKNYLSSAQANYFRIELVWDELLAGMQTILKKRKMA